MMELAIVTGVSKGLGESIAQLLIKERISVIGISRSGNKKLATVAEQHGVSFVHYTCDLGSLEAIDKVCDDIDHYIRKQDVQRIYLINNAAILEPIDQSMNIKPYDLANHVQVNTVAPMVMMNYFLRRATDETVPFYGVTITSGAATRPIYGWSAYCSTKASINMYTQTVALEQDTLKTGHKVIAFSPGIMDTAMQEKIRDSSREAFIDVDTFRQYKQDNQLKDTDTIGSILVNILRETETIENGKVYNAADYF